MNKRIYQYLAGLFLFLSLGLFFYSSNLYSKYYKMGQERPIEEYSVELNNKGHIVYITQEQDKVLGSYSFVFFMLFGVTAWFFYKGFCFANNWKQWNDLPIRKK